MSVSAPLPERPVISLDMIDAIKVQFLKPIFEDDFPEKGMKAWLVDVEWDSRNESYKLYFNFKDFEAENEKYFKETFYPTSRLKDENPGRQLFTALETGNYRATYSVFFSPEVQGNFDRNDEEFTKQILSYLRVVD